MTGATQPPPVPQPEIDQAVPECPYVGLVPFDESDAPYFFGRQRECEVVAANLTVSRLTLFYAESGVGKSSVLRAGVLPLLQPIAGESYKDLGVPDAAVAYVREWSLDPLDTLDPLDAIATAVLEGVSRSRVPGADPVEVPGPPRLSVPWLREVLQRSGVAAVYLVLDQFEEYFLYHPNDRGEDGLAGALGHILSTRDLPVNVLLSIREDALAALDRFEGWVPHLYDNYLRLEHLGRNAAREAIERPLDRYNKVVPPDSAMKVDPELIKTLLDQVRTGHLAVAPEGAAPSGVAADREDIEAPFLQLVLTRLWEAERASGSSVLRLGTLNKMGGAQTIVQTHLQTVMDRLSPEQTEIAAKVFLYLVTPSGSKIALTAKDLTTYLSGVPESSVQELLESLSEGRQRILRPVPPAREAAPRRYEIFHDVMRAPVRDWRRQYVAQAEASRKLAAEREKARAEAQAAQEEASRKLAAEREKARAEAQATRRRLHRLLAAGLVVLLIALVLGVVSYIYYREAEKQRLLSDAATALGENPVVSLRKAVEADQTKADDKTREAVLTAASLVPRSLVVAGSPGDQRVVGMVVTPDQRHVVTYNAQGGIRIIVIGDDGRVEKKEARASRLAGTVVLADTSPDASHVVLVTDRGSAAVIDVRTGTQVDLNTGGSPVHDVSWLDSSPDNLVLVVTSADLAATYSAKTGLLVTRFPGTVYRALPIGAKVVTSNLDSRLRIWDARTAEKVAESSLLSSPSDNMQRYGHQVIGVVAGVPGGRNIIRWDWQASPDPHEYPISFSNTLAQVAVSEDTHTVTIALDKEARTYSLDNGSRQRILPPQPDQVFGVALAPHGRWIATAGDDGRIRVWSAKDIDIGIPNRATYELIGHHGPVQSVRYLRDGKSLISLGDDGAVRLWDLPQIQRFDLHKSWVLDLDMSADGRWLATASYDGTVHIVDLAGGSNIPVVTVPVGGRVEDVQFDPTDPHRIVTLTRYGTQPVAWRWDSGRGAERLPGFFEAPSLGPPKLVNLDVSQDGKRVAARGSDGNIYLWDAHTGKLIGDRALMGSGQGASGIAFDVSGHMLAATGPDGVLLKKLGTKEEPKPLGLPNATTVAFGPRGEHIVGGANGVLRVWTSEGQYVRDLAAHGSTVGRPSFSGDGRLVAVGTGEGLIEVWNVDSGQRVMLARQHGNAVNDVLFLPGHPSRLVSASDDSTVAVFPCDACDDPDAFAARVVDDVLRESR